MISQIFKRQLKLIGKYVQVDPSKFLNILADLISLLRRSNDIQSMEFSQ
jgi:hypothetical protein